MARLTVISKRVYSKGDLPRQLLPRPRPCGEPLLTLASTGDPPICAGSFASVSHGSLWSFPLSLGARKVLCPLQDWSPCFPQSCGSVVIKSRWASRSDSLKIPSPFVRSPGGKPEVVFQTFTTVGELLWYYCSPVYGSATRWVWDLLFLKLHVVNHLSSCREDVQFDLLSKINCGEF